MAYTNIRLILKQTPSFRQTTQILDKRHKNIKNWEFFKNIISKPVRYFLLHN